MNAKPALDVRVGDRVRVRSGIYAAAASVAIHGDRVIVNAGGALTEYAATDRVYLQPEATPWQASAGASSTVKLVHTYSMRTGPGTQRHRGFRGTVWRIDEQGRRQEQGGPFAKKRTRAIEYAGQLARALNKEQGL